MKKFITCTFFLFLSVNICASSLSIPNEFEFIAVNGNPVENPLFSKNTRLTLTTGEQKIALLYKNMLRDDIGNGSTIVTSPPIIISLLVKEGQDYQLSSAYKIKSVSAAKAFIKDPQIHVKNAQGELASSTLYLVKTDDRGVLGNIIKKKENNRQTVAVLETLSEKGREGKENRPEKMLHHWWGQADAETQKQFLSWAIKQIK